MRYLWNKVDTMTTDEDMTSITLAVSLFVSGGRITLRVEETDLDTEVEKSK